MCSNANIFTRHISPKRPLSNFELSKSVESNLSKPNFTSRYNFEKVTNPFYSSRGENLNRASKMPDFRRSFDRVNIYESTTTTTSNSSGKSDNKLKPPLYKPSVEKRFNSFKSMNAQNLFKEPVKIQRKTSLFEKIPTYNDNDSYLDSIRHLSSSQLNTYIEKLIKQFRIKTKINVDQASGGSGSGEKKPLTKLETSKLDSSCEQNQNVNNLYRDDLFDVSEMSVKNSNASQDTYIKNIINEDDEDYDDEDEGSNNNNGQEESLNVEDLNLEDESERSNDLINYTHSYELEDVSSDNTSFNQESNSRSLKK